MSNKIERTQDENLKRESVMAAKVCSSSYFCQKKKDCKTFTTQTFTTPDVHHPLCKIRHSPPQTFTTSDVHHLRRSPPQTFTTSDIHHPRRSPPPILKCDIHQGCLDCRNILNAWTVGEFSFGGDDCRGWGMLVGGFFFLASNAQEHIYSKT